MIISVRSATMWSSAAGPRREALGYHQAGPGRKPAGAVEVAVPAIREPDACGRLNLRA